MHGRTWVKAVVVAMALGVSVAAQADGWRARDGWQAGARGADARVDWHRGWRGDRDWNRDWRRDRRWRRAWRREHYGFGYRFLPWRAWHRWHDRDDAAVVVRPYGYWWDGGPVIIYRDGR